MPLDREWIERHIPHQGTMCLLDEVLTWNTSRVQCRSSSHRDRSNPLRSHDRLAAVCGIEYAAQAMAVHGALIASRLTASRKNEAIVGYLASVRNVVLHANRLDDVEADLVATAEPSPVMSVLCCMTFRSPEMSAFCSRAAPPSYLMPPYANLR